MTAHETAITVPAEQVPTYIKASLSTGEEVRAVFRYHWIMRVVLWVWVLASVLTLGLLAPVALFIWLTLRSVEQGLTNKRVITKRGIISRKTDEMKISSVETVELDQGVFGRILGYGNVRITGRGTSDVIIRNVEDPMDVKRRIESISNPA